MKISGVKGRQFSFAVSSGIKKNVLWCLSGARILRGQSMTLSITVMQDKPTRTRGQMSGIVSLQRLQWRKRQRQSLDGVPIMVDGRSLDARGKSTRY